MLYTFMEANAEIPPGEKLSRKNSTRFCQVAKVQLAINAAGFRAFFGRSKAYVTPLIR
jgi:hypothetical protein